MEKNNFGSPNYDPQLHLFEDNRPASLENSKKEDTVGKPITPVFEIKNDSSETLTEDFLKKQKAIISKYKIGPDAVNHLNYKAEEANDEDETSGWYVRNKKLRDWHEMIERVYNDDDEEYQYSWQKYNNK